MAEKQQEDLSGEDIFAAEFAKIAAASSAGADTTPAPGGEDTLPAASGEDTTPAAGGDDTLPASSGDDTAPAASGDDTAPASDGTADTTSAPETPPAAPAPAAPAPVTPPAESPEDKAAREQYEELQKPYVLTPEQQAAVDTMKRDYPTEYLAMEAQLAAVNKSVDARMAAAMSNFMKQMSGIVVPLKQQTEVLANERHNNAVLAAHADRDIVAAKIPGWIETQPKFMQPELRRVYEQGDTASVIELISTYKKSVGVPSGGESAPAASAPAAPAVKKPAADAASLLPVAAKRPGSVPRGEPDKNDFDAAWRELSEAVRAK